MPAFDVFRHDQLPRWALVRQPLEASEVGDVAAAVSNAIASVANRLPPHGTVCLALGSRGIDRIAEVARASVADLRRRGLDVFAVPAMGSHGGATAGGQLAVLASLGITPESIGCEIRSSMDTVLVGQAGDTPVYVDRHAATEADLIVPINRVKPHTDFSAPIESGLAKMISIGLGKQHGANVFHARGFPTFSELVPAVTELSLARLPIRFGIALVENGHARLARIEAVPAERLLERERELLRDAYQLMPRLPTTTLDVLIIDEIGKDISGLGMDSNVVGRYYDSLTPPPAIQRIVVRGLTEATEGNAVGIGLADVVLRRAATAMDAAKTYMNAITAKTPEGARIALTVETDREAVDVALACCIGVSPEAARILRIRNTKHLEWLYASEALVADLSEAGCQVEPLREMGFDAAGELVDSMPL